MYEPILTIAVRIVDQDIWPKSKKAILMPYILPLSSTFVMSNQMASREGVMMPKPIPKTAEMAAKP
jgi:sorbitol-specific phosphotransferase system component IIC